jgi:hypothetical protein
MFCANINVEIFPFPGAGLSEGRKKGVDMTTSSDFFAVVPSGLCDSEPLSLGRLDCPFEI